MRISRTVHWAIASCLFAVIIARSITLSFSIDEAMTYNFVIDEWDRIIANNHKLNTFLMKVFGRVFGHSEWALRLPNSMSFILYAWASWRLVRRIPTSWMAVMASLILLVQPNLIEFFSLARGYALGTALLFTSAVLTIEALDSDCSDGFSRRRILYASLLASFGLGAYLASVNVFIMLSACILGLQIWKWKRFGWSSLIPTGLVLAAGFAWGVNELLELSASEELFYGNESYIQFWERFQMYYLWPVYGPYFMRPSTMLNLLALGMLWPVLIWSLSRKLRAEIVVPLILLVGAAIGWVIEFEVFDSLLPMHRTSLIYYPLLGMLVVGFISGMKNVNKPFIKFPTMAVFAVFAFVILGNFSKAVDFHTLREWGGSADVKTAMMIVKEYSDELPREAEIEKHYNLRSEINYYIRTRGMNVGVNMNMGTELNAEFLLLRIRDFKYAFDDERLTSKYELVGDYPDSGLRLYIRKDVLSKTSE
ncbi:MAG: glycosyltransferase family 39 protein [Flavobacteriia bacterium]|nr:glycosyltransferase family 39 protein [Flavobacteriia bacterium]